ncbi:MAG TPA: hypothetical protein VFQ99_01135 [Gallionella sp.]|nr:hypothetical protein [Gallionella sp.]
MRIIISFIAASMFAATGSTAWAGPTSAEPAKTEAPAAPVTSATPGKSAEAAKPTAQANAVEPRKSGLDQPLCTGE